MTFQEKKDFLNQYKTCIRRIDALTLEYQKWETVATAITQKLSAVPGISSGNKSKTEIGGQMAEIMRKIEVEIKTAESLRDNIQDAIKSRCNKERYRELLEYRYINGMPFRTIADIIDKDERTARRVLNSAINSLAL